MTVALTREFRRGRFGWILALGMAAACVLLAAHPQAARASTTTCGTGVTDTWQGTDNTWAEDANWSAGCVPGPDTTVVIGDGLPGNGTISVWPSGTVTIGALQLGNQDFTDAGFIEPVLDACGSVDPCATPGVLLVVTGAVTIMDGTVRGASIMAGADSSIDGNGLDGDYPADGNSYFDAGSSYQQTAGTLTVACGLGFASGDRLTIGTDSASAAVVFTADGGACQVPGSTDTATQGFLAASGAMVSIVAGSTFSTNTDDDPAGSQPVLVNAGTLDIGAGAQLVGASGIELAADTANLPAGTVAVNTGLQLANGVTNADAGGTVLAGSGTAISWTNGQIGGKLTVSNPASTTSIDGGALTLASGATFVVGGDVRIGDVAGTPTQIAGTHGTLVLHGGVQSGLESPVAIAASVQIVPSPAAPVMLNTAQTELDGTANVIGVSGAGGVTLKSLSGLTLGAGSTTTLGDDFTVAASALLTADGSLLTAGHTLTAIGTLTGMGSIDGVAIGSSGGGTSGGTGGGAGGGAAPGALAPPSSTTTPPVKLRALSASLVFPSRVVRVKRPAQSLAYTCTVGHVRCSVSVKLVVTQVTKSKRGKRVVHYVTVGTASGVVVAGRRLTMKVRFTAAGRKLLRASKHLTVTYVTSVTDTHRRKAASRKAVRLTIR